LWAAWKPPLPINALGEWLRFNAQRPTLNTQLQTIGRNYHAESAQSVMLSVEIIASCEDFFEHTG
jgi:hypothetical protein